MSTSEKGVQQVERIVEAVDRGIYHNHVQARKRRMISRGCLIAPLKCDKLPKRPNKITKS